MFFLVFLTQSVMWGIAIIHVGGGDGIVRNFNILISFSDSSLL